MHERSIGAFGIIRRGVDTSAALRIYDLPTDPAFIDYRWAREFSDEPWTYGVFSFPDNPPDFRRSYNERHVWIYDPAQSHGAFRFPDWTVEQAIHYTRAWRVTHEHGHGRTHPTIERRFGPGKRKGRYGVELSANDAARALAWEDAAFREQRYILERLAVKVSDEDFAREWRINMADAVHRVLTGDFSDPGPDGFEPFGGVLRDGDAEIIDACASVGGDVVDCYRKAVS